MPSEFAAGTTVVYTRTLTDFPASAGWTLTVYLRGAGTLTKAAAPSGDDFVVTLAGSDTGPLPPGGYEWSEFATDTSVPQQRFKATDGFVVISPDPALAGAGDMQLWEEKELALIQLVKEGRITADVQAYQIDGTALTRIPIEKLWEREKYLLRRISRIQAIQSSSAGAPTSPFAATIPIIHRRLGGH